jgi:hypothetical protein
VGLHYIELDLDSTIEDGWERPDWLHPQWVDYSILLILMFTVKATRPPWVGRPRAVNRRRGQPTSADPRTASTATDASR